MRKYTSVSYDRRIPQAKTVCALPPAPEPPPPPPPPPITYLISGEVSRLGSPLSTPIVFVDGTTPLSDWTLGSTVNLASIVNNASGAAYNPNTDSVWVPNNSTNALYEYDADGNYLRTITTGGFSDVEAVCWMYGSYFGILEEDTSSITVAQFLPSTGSIWKWANQVIDTGLGNLDVLTGGGLEGVAYNPQEDVFYAVKERQSALPTRDGMKFYRIEWSGSYSEPWSAPAMLPSYVTDLSDIHYDPRTGRAYLLSDESEAIIEVDPTTGSVYQVMNWPSGMLQPEGLSFTPDYTKMWIVSEPNQMRIYTRDYVSITSSVAGSYGYLVSPGWSGTSVPSYTDGTLVPNSYSYLNVGMAYPNQDFEVTYPTITISGQVLLDLNLLDGADVEFSGLGVIQTSPHDLALIYVGTVPYGWSGTVTTPEYLAHPLAFDVVPGSRVYSNLTSSQTSQDFTITSKVYSISGTYGDEFGSGGFDDYWVTNGTATWIATKFDGSFGFDVLGGWSGSVAATQYIADPGSYAYASVTANQPFQNFDNPYPFITTANANLSWAWPLANPERWLIIAKHPVTMIYSDFGTTAGSVYGLDVTPNFGTWFSVVGMDYKSDYNTNVSNEVQTSAPVISLQGSIFTADTGSGFPANVYVTGVGTVASALDGQWGASVTWGYSGTAAVADVVAGSWVPAYRTYDSIIATQSGQDFAFVPAAAGTFYLISGTMTEDGTGFSGAIEVDGVGTISTAASGSYGVLVADSYSGSFTPHDLDGTFVPASRYFTALSGDVPNQDWAFYRTPAPTDCQIPLALQTVTDLPTPNDVSRSVNDPVNNLLWYLDDSYDYVYYVDAVAGTFQGSITMPTGFGQSAIAYDAVNAKVVVMAWTGSIYYIDPVAKTSNRVPGISMVSPGYHMLTVNQYGTAYATDNRQVVSGSVWAIDGSTETLIRSTKLGVATDSICWASNINKLVINSGGAGAPAFYLFDPVTDTFAASTLLNPLVSFRYENFYIPQTGHMLESFSGGSPSAVIDISQGTAATQIATIQPTRVSNADIDTCTNHLFVTNGNYAMWEYTLDGSYTLLNLFTDGGAGISPNSCSHNRQSNLVYVANYSDGTIYTFEATRESGSIGGLVWEIDQGVEPDTTGGYAAMAGGLGWFSGSAVGEDTTPLQGYAPDLTASLSNLDAPYPATMQVVYAGSINDSGTLQVASSVYLQAVLNGATDDVSINGTITGTNTSFAGTLTVNGTISTGYNSFELYTSNYCGGNFTASPCNTYVAVAGSISITPLTPP